MVRACYDLGWSVLFLGWSWGELGWSGLGSVGMSSKYAALVWPWAGFYLSRSWSGRGPGWSLVGLSMGRVGHGPSWAQPIHSPFPSDAYPMLSP
jgi:hypothetical protein